MADFGEASGQYPSHSERAAWLQGSSWDGRATWKQVSSSEEARVASCAAAKTAIFNMLCSSDSMMAKHETSVYLRVERRKMSAFGPASKP